MSIIGRFAHFHYPFSLGFNLSVEKLSGLNLPHGVTTYRFCPALCHNFTIIATNILVHDTFLLFHLFGLHHVQV